MTARIALDAMGGDHAPHQTVLGALDAAARGVDVVLVGDTPQIEAELVAAGSKLPIVHAPEVVAMEDDPASAIRAKKGASVTAAIVIGRLQGVSRPAIATIFPMGTPAVVLDIGANLEVRPAALAEFGVMGSVLAEIYLGREAPKVGLLNIGEETGKGRVVEKEAHLLLEQMPIDFIGNVEGRDLGTDKAHVFVTDGFTGNVLLKTAEGVARVVAGVVLETLADDDDPAFQEAAGAVLPKLLAVRQRFDPEAHGGAHLVGVKGTVVISHGSSSRVAVANALQMAAEGAEQGLPAKIEAGLHG